MVLVLSVVVSRVRARVDTVVDPHREHLDARLGPERVEAFASARDVGGATVDVGADTPSTVPGPPQ